MITPEQLAKSGSEHGHQAALFCWAALAESRTAYPQLKWLYAVPNGFFGSAGQKAKMIAEGLRSGVPDICLPVIPYNNIPNYHGLYIELKVGNGKLSTEQSKWLFHLNSQGYKIATCYGWEAARDMIISYLEGY